MLSELRTAISKSRQYRRAERLSRAQLEALKLDKFRRLVRHANQHSPWNRDIIAGRGINMPIGTSRAMWRSP